MPIQSLPADDPYGLMLYELLDVYGESQGFNTRKHDVEPYLFVLRDDSENANILGGIQGLVSGGWLDIYSLYSNHTVKGVGTRLVDHIEDYARQKSCHGVKLITYPFQAPGFYQKRGYEVYGTVPDVVNGYDIIYMKKAL